jgi:hypothetical protein
VRRFVHLVAVGEQLAVTLLLVAILAAAVLVRSAPASATDAQLVVGADPRTPAELTADAAAALEASVREGAAGYTFEIVQRSTIVARPGGPLIEIPDPIDRTKSLGTTDRYALDGLIERGAVTPAGFWMEMRQGPVGDAAADWGAPYEFGAIARDDTTWRNDGAGWYETDSPPGIGLDPRTAALLPTLLRNATDAADAEPRLVDGESRRSLTVTAKVADIPGVIAVDAEPFTELAAPIEMAFDDAGRLVQLHVLARNANLDEWDLMVDTVITFRYPATADPLPEPLPALTDTRAERKP